MPSMNWRHVCVIVAVSMLLGVVTGYVQGCCRHQADLKYWCVKAGHTNAECNFDLR